MKKKKDEIKIKEPVKIRYKELADGRKSIFLATYFNKKYHYEFLKEYLYPDIDKYKTRNENTLKRVLRVKSQRITELEKYQEHLENNTKQSKVLLRNFIRILAATKEKSTQQNFNSLAYHLERYNEIDIQIGKVDKEYIIGFISYLEKAEIEHTERNKGKKLSKNTQAMYFKCLRMALDEAVSDEIIVSNPVYSIKKKNRPTTEKAVKREFLTQEELKRFAETDFPNELVKRAFITGCLTGLRHCDIRQLKWGNIGVIKNGIEYISIIQEKTDEPVDIPLKDNIKRWLPERNGASDNDLVFDGLLSLGRTNEILPKWAKMAGINKHLTFHISRHTFAVLAIANGINIYTVSKLLGHQSIKVTEIYTDVLDSSLDNAMDKMNDNSNI